MFNIWNQDEIPYREQADKLFNLLAWQKKITEGQQIIPFLGAGVSISAKPAAAKSELADPPPDEKIDECCRALGLEGDSARLFVRMAAFLAVSLEAAEKTSPSLSDDELLDKLQKAPSPPSARQLARLFANLSTYTAFRQTVHRFKDLFPEGFIKASERQQIDMLKRIARITRIADPPDPLTSITSYYENKIGRPSLWSNLSLVISGKNEPTPTHKLLAAAAKHHFDQPDVWQDYLILTTNYDCLMEDALDRAGVDYVVLATRKRDQKVLVRFSDGIKNADKFTALNSGVSYPDKLYLRKPKNMVVICKIHGCLNPRLTERDDGVIISDNDYVNYISQMNSAHGPIPAYVSGIMQDKPFLFLGYSLSDWNVRSVFETIRKKRGEESDERQDYAVTSYVGEYEQLFFKKNQVTILQTDLNAFASSVVSELEKLKRNNPELWGNLVDNVLDALSRMDGKEVVNATT